jgi:hypothetical protein
VKIEIDHEEDGAQALIDIIVVGEGPHDVYQDTTYKEKHGQKSR